MTWTRTCEMTSAPRKPLDTGATSKSCARHWATPITSEPLQRFRLDLQHDPRVLQLSGYLLDYPFADRLYPGALEAVKHCRRWGPTVILSDGDAVFQPRKLERSGIQDAVEGRVLIYIHKELMLDEVTRRYPARRYVMVDDKLRLLAAMKSVLADRLFTVFPRQGHYARDAAAIRDLPSADLNVEHIGDLASYDFGMLTGVHDAD